MEWGTPISVSAWLIMGYFDEGTDTFGWERSRVETCGGRDRPANGEDSSFAPSVSNIA